MSFSFQSNEENNNEPPKYDAPKPPYACLKPRSSPKPGSSPRSSPIPGSSPKPGSSPIVSRAKFGLSPPSQETEDYAMPYFHKPKSPDPNLKPVPPPAPGDTVAEDGSYLTAWDDKDLYVNQADKPPPVPSRPGNAAQACVIPVS